jgi:hypothetical protein
MIDHLLQPDDIGEERKQDAVFRFTWEGSFEMDNTMPADEPQFFHIHTTIV